MVEYEAIMENVLRVEIRTGKLTGWGARVGSDGTVKRWLSVASQSGGRITSDGEEIDYDIAIVKYADRLDDDIQDSVEMEIVTSGTSMDQLLEFCLLRD